jgi:hypothetical protein
MPTRYECGNERRRSAVRQASPARLNGIDYLEVGGDQRELTVVFVHPLPGASSPVPPVGPALTAANVVIEGGVRIQPVRVTSVQATGNVLRVSVDRPGDFSTYTLRLRTSATVAVPPAGFDPQLAAVDFWFKVDCPSEFDCGPSPAVSPPAALGPEPDYLAKDYASFRQLMLDRLSAVMPRWREESVADLPVTLIELLAYVGDELSYFQDAVATEAYLGTARQRMSVRRHARLLDYPMHEGVNARAWVVFEVEAAADGRPLPEESVLLTGGNAATPTLPSEDLDAAWTDGAIGFETGHAITLRAALNEITFYTWSDTECTLPRGATRATLTSAASLDLRRGDFLLFEEIRGPESGREVDADPTRRHVVRLTAVTRADAQGAALTDPLTGTPVVEIEWSDEDALPFPLALSGPFYDAANHVLPLAVARGNVVLADHGRRFSDSLLPDTVVAGETYRPRLARGPLTWMAPLELGTGPLEFRSAAAMLRSEPRKAMPDVRLRIGSEPPWEPAPDLLDSGRFDEHFIVETTSDGIAHLRFGDGMHGKPPAVGTKFDVRYRVGNGRAGNLGAGAITRVVFAGAGIARVRNPLPATGGVEPEPIDDVRRYAPYAFRTQERAVTAADYAEVAERHPGVQKAAATMRWTGSWHTVFVTIDRKDGRPVDAAFEDVMRQHLERYRLAGGDVEIDAPRPAPLDIVLKVCVAPGYQRSDVKRSLLDVFSNRDLPDGRRGIFHPDHFTFGDPLYLSRIYQVAMAVAGVASVDVLKLQRWGRAANQEIDLGVLRTERLEILRVDNDPNFPEMGRIEFEMDGGA